MGGRGPLPAMAGGDRAVRPAGAGIQAFLVGLLAAMLAFFGRFFAGEAPEPRPWLKDATERRKVGRRGRFCRP